MSLLLFAFWFFLPAGLANATPVFASKISWLKHRNVPLDFGKKYKGQRIFGPNKTWRGVIAGTVVSSLVVTAQYCLARHGSRLECSVPGVIDYSSPGVLVLGPLLGFGALAGDAIASFFKRQAKVPAGKSWFPFDQLDYIAGGLLLSLFVARLSAEQYVAIVAVWFVVHLVGTYIGHKLGLKPTPI